MRIYVSVAIKLTKTCYLSDSTTCSYISSSSSPEEGSQNTRSCAADASIACVGCHMASTRSRWEPSSFTTFLVDTFHTNALPRLLPETKYCSSGEKDAVWHAARVAMGLV